MKYEEIPNTCQYTMSREISEMYWKMLGINSGNVLDVGSGMGGLGISKPKNVCLYGIERDATIADKSINYSNIFVGDLEVITDKLFDGVEFDAIFARDILEHLDKPWVLLSKIAKQSRQGAKIICSVPKAIPKVVWNDYTHIRGYTKQSLKSMLENSGFEVEAIFPMSGYTLATKLGFAHLLPLIGRVPLLNKLMISWHAIGRKVG